MVPRAITSSGRLVGNSEKGILSFKGIPFAVPPVGDLRWRPPVPVPAWSGERDAIAFGPSAMQQSNPGMSGDLIGIPSEKTDEDCLYLNVWTPGLAGNRPVMVWIHGGGNTVGSGSQPRINGEHLSRRGDVVVVTFNYRLGAFGFLHAPELGASGNEALLDQIAALRWVQSEIAVFGGDAGNVTVFGQSAGGFDIAKLMGMPQARGCFNRIIPLSGSLTPSVPREAAETTAAQFAKQFDGMEKLRKIPAKDILDYQLTLSQQPQNRARFAPVADGVVCADDDVEAIEKGTYTRGLPLLIGNTLNEGTLFTTLSGALDGLDEEGLVRMAGPIFKTQAAHAVDVYRKAREKRGEPVTPLAIWTAMATDQMFRIPAIRTAEFHSAHTADTWMYLFDYPSPALEGKLGSCHSLDIPFIWGTHGVEKMKRFCGKGPVVDQLSQRMMDLYLAFARNGAPSIDSLPEWPAYDPRKRSTMHLGETCWVEEAPMEEERELWASLLR